MNRTLAAARLCAIRPLGGLAIPWLVVLLSFAVNLAVWGLAHLGDQADAGTGGLASLYITVGVVFLQTVTQLFPFGLGMGLSRRAFYAGTALVALVQSIGYGVVLTVLAAIERATDGWWVGLRFFAPYGVADESPVRQFLAYTAVMLAAGFLGIAIGVVAKRWGPAGLYTLAIGSLLVLGGASVLVTALHGWSSVGHWLTGQSLLTLAFGYAAAIALIAAALSYGGLRRAVP